MVYSCNWEDHLTNLERVFERLCSANLTLNLAKCEFAKAVVTYLGKKVGQGCVRPVTAKVIAVIEFPTSVTQVLRDGWILSRFLQELRNCGISLN